MQYLQQILLKIFQKVLNFCKFFTIISITWNILKMFFEIITNFTPKFL